MKASKLIVTDFTTFTDEYAYTKWLGNMSHLKTALKHLNTVYERNNANINGLYTSLVKHIVDGLNAVINDEEDEYDKFGIQYCKLVQEAHINDEKAYIVLLKMHSTDTKKNDLSEAAKNAIIKVYQPQCTDWNAINITHVSKQGLEFFS